MLEKKLDEDTIFLRVDGNEDILSAIEKVSQKYGLNSGKIEGIGSLKKAVLGYYTGEEYVKIEINENLELISCMGSISRGEEYVVHLHAVLGDEEGKAMAGHLFEGIVSFTGEFFIESFPEKLERKYDTETGLNLIE
ncbi:MAG: PPC domain-containing DNA-binding protein [Euryarchaeota archaeon]|nr:PPC domain-containing DNA-binding protein [Euryarchaeota archaeon]